MIVIKYLVSGHLEGKEFEPYFEEQIRKTETYDSKELADYDYDYDSSFSAGAVCEYIEYKAVEIRSNTQAESEKEKLDQERLKEFCDKVNKSISERIKQEELEHKVKQLRKQRELQLQNVTNDFLDLLNPENFEKVFELDGKRYRMEISVDK